MTMLLGMSLRLMPAGGHAQVISTSRLASLAFPPTSWLSVPLSVDLSVLSQSLEDAMPRVFESGPAWILVDEGRVGIRYRASRAPFALSFQDGTLRLSTRVDYEAEGCVVRQRALFGGMSCDPEADRGRGETRKQIHVAGTTRLGWTPDWHLAARTSFQFGHPERSLVTFLAHDVTTHVDAALALALDRAAAAMDERLREVLDAHRVAEQVWRAASEPIPLGASLWLRLTPTELRVAAPREDGPTLRTSLELRLRPSLALDPKPLASPRAMPSLQVGAPSEGFHLTVENHLSFAEASRLVEARLPSRFAFPDLEVEVQGAELSGDPSRARLKLQVRLLSGLPNPTDVTLWLKGRPRYDPATGLLALEDLDYAVETSSTAVKRLDQNRHAEMLVHLRQRLRWPVGEQVDSLRARLEVALSASLFAKESLLAGTLQTLQPLDISLTRTGFRLVLEATGAVAAKLNRLSPPQE
ncbi:DUF4403 family protein [Corallococcus exercitus]|uniref:DUF4403 family protein n=1 Tax=Corallococcus exercitus TaxID=2316736 RepID=A0A7Y4JN06_9BACT|nr:DUF4403 family protein [Corallococcus exercitus]NOK08014.1 DUF4403 family protein [Corallococcus exercitus]